MYKIIRMFTNSSLKDRAVRGKGGLTLAQAKKHCKDPETHSKTATGYAARKRTQRYGHWFDGYEPCKK